MAFQKDYGERKDPVPLGIGSGQLPKLEQGNEPGSELGAHRETKLVKWDAVGRGMQRSAAFCRSTPRKSLGNLDRHSTNPLPSTRSSRAIEGAAMSRPLCLGPPAP